MSQTKKIASCYLNTNLHFATVAKIDTTNGLTQEVVRILNHRGNFVDRTNNVPVRKRKNTVMIKGKPDIVGTSKLGYSLNVEIKNEKTKDKQSDEQKEFQVNVIKRGGIYIIVKSIEDFYKQLETYQHSI